MRGPGHELGGVSRLRQCADRGHESGRVCHPLAAENGGGLTIKDRSEWLYVFMRLDLYIWNDLEGIRLFSW